MHLPNYVNTHLHSTKTYKHLFLCKCRSEQTATTTYAITYIFLRFKNLNLVAIHKLNILTLHLILTGYVKFRFNENNRLFSRC